MKKAKLTKQMLVLTTPEEHEFIKSLSEENDLSMGQIIRSLIKEKQKEVGFHTSILLNKGTTSNCHYVE